MCNPKSIVDPQGRFIIFKAGIQDKVYILVNIYAPNKDKVSGKCYKNLHRVLQTEDLDCEENIIIGGDFNCPLDPKLDKKGGVIVPRKMVIDNIECLQNELDLVDVWRIKNPQSRSYTWSQKRPPIFCRLDYWLISNNLQDFVNTTDIIPAIKTDHEDLENYLEELKQNIPLWKTTGSDNLSDKRCIWDWLKYNIRKHAILFSKKKAKERSALEKNLQQVYEEATKKFEQDPSDSNLNTLNEAKEILESYYEEKNKGCNYSRKGTMARAWREKYKIFSKFRKA